MSYSFVSATVLISLIGCTLQEKCNEGDYAVLFEDCSAFDHPNFFAGPVCGSDGATYPNSLYVRCLNYHDPSLDINVNYKGKCTPWGQACPYSPFYDPVCGTDGKTYANLEALVCHVTVTSSAHVGVAHEGPCVKSEDHSCSPHRHWEEWGRNPVCGNNGLTYINIAEVRCLQLHQPDLTVVRDGGCTLYEAKKKAAPSTNASCVLAGERFEWNPVCGEDNLTYHNPFVFLCQHPDLSVQFQGVCDSPVRNSCLMAAAIDREELKNNREMCGSDGRTYKSEYHLHCETLKDKYLWTKHVGRCKVEDDPCLLRGWPHLDGPGQPVCGSDGKTYVSPAAIWCRHTHHDPCLQYLHDGECLVTETMAFL